jgi:hypothetical protein
MGRTGGTGKMGDVRWHDPRLCIWLRSRPGLILCVLCALGVLRADTVHAQFQMPDPKQMSGIPRPVDDLPDGSISVRLIRGALSNNIANHPVQLLVDGKSTTANTDEAGRAQFDKVEAGAAVKASADVDGEHLESSEFQAPSRGGIRLLLVATDKSKGSATSPEAPAVSGQVAIGGQSRIVIEPGDEAVTVYYLLDISNTARVPVNPPSLFMFDVPAEAVGTTIMQGSTDRASVKGTRVRVQGPFPPGQTALQIGSELPAGTGSVTIMQQFPATLEQFALIVKKAGDTVVRSPQIARQQEFPADGEVYIAATGATVPAGQPITIELSGLPHHSRAPRTIALALAIAIAAAGIWSATRSEAGGTRLTAERKKLVAKRDRLLNDLVRLERERRSGRVDEIRYAARREQLIAALEPIYGTLDGDIAGEGERSGRTAGAPPIHQAQQVT